jgi:hypothetical protein
MRVELTWLRERRILGTMRHQTDLKESLHGLKRSGWEKLLDDLAARKLLAEPKYLILQRSVVLPPRPTLSVRSLFLF